MSTLSVAKALRYFQVVRLKNGQLKHLAFLTGLPSNAKKAGIEAILADGIRNARLPDQGARILSIDMGIRNLAYCVVDVPGFSNLKNGTGRDFDAPSSLNIKAWKRADVLRPDNDDCVLANSESELESPTAAIEVGKQVRKAKAAALDKDAFGPAAMSKVAYNIAVDLLDHQPTTILIERQRFRSQGASTILEWTLRVNVFEAMLHACFETLSRVDSDKHRARSAVHEVSPQRVAQFWTTQLWTSGVRTRWQPDNGIHDNSGASQLEGADKVPGKAIKTRKMAVLRNWIAGKGDISLDFSVESDSVAKRFAKLNERKTANGVEAAGYGTGKLDDLADCMLQAAAWVRWEENRQKIAAFVEENTLHWTPSGENVDLRSEAAFKTPVKS